MISDIESPVFAKSNECKRGIFVSKQTLPGKKYAEVYFESIDIHDNSGDQPTVKCSYRNNQPCNYESVSYTHLRAHETLRSRMPSSA